MPVTQNGFVSAQTLKTAYAVCDTANTDLDDSPTTVVALLTAGSNGAIVYALKATPRATVTATRLGLYLSKNGGATKRLVRQATMPAATVSTAAGAFSTDLGGFGETNPLRLEAGDMLYVDIGVSLAAGIVFDAEYEEL